MRILNGEEVATQSKGAGRDGKSSGGSPILRGTGTALALALSALLLPVSAVAQDEAEDTSGATAAEEGTPPAGTQDEVGGKGEPETVLPPVVVLGTPEEMKRLPGSGQRIDVFDLRKFSRDDIGQVLRDVPGVYVRPEDGLGLFPNLSFRGVDTVRMSKLTVLEDGVPAVPAPYAAPEAYYSPTTGRMYGIEVLKGSSQVRYGPHTTGGVLNYLSTPIPEEPSGYLKTVFGSFGDVRLHGWYGGSWETSNGRLGLLLEGYRREVDGFKTIDGAPGFEDRDRTGFTKEEPMFKISFEPTGTVPMRFEVKYGTTDLDADETYLGLTEDDFDRDPYRRYAGSRFDNIETEQRRFHFRWQVEPVKRLRWTTTWYYSWFSRDWFKLNDVRTSTGRVGMSRALAEGGEALAILRGNAAGELRVRHNSRDYYLKGVESVAEYSVPWGETEHRLSLGARVHEDQVDRFQWDVNYTQAANGAITAQSATAKGSAGNREETARAGALFLQDEIQAGEWTITPGVRHERVRVKNEDFNAPADSGRETIDVTAAGVGASKKVGEDVTAFGGVFRGFSVPGPGAAVADGLDEETSLAYELGVRHEREDKVLRTEATLFWTDFDDLIVVDNVGGAGTGRSENVGSIRTRGVELSGRYDLGRDSGWSVRNPWTLAVTYTDARLSSDSNSTDAESIFAGGGKGNHVPYIPRWSVGAGTGIETDKWGVYLSAHWVTRVYSSASNTGSQRTPTGTPDARFGRIPGYAVLDLAAHYQVSDSTKVLVGINNVFDKEYMVSRHPHGPRPGMPLSAYLGLEVNF